MVESLEVMQDTLSELPDGDIEETTSLFKYLDAGNIVDQIPDHDKACQDALEAYEEARESMLPWLKKYKRAINLAKLQAMSGDTEINEKNFPFDGASLVMMPFILEAMLDFSSRASGELVWAKEIVKAKVYGKHSEQKEQRAKRVSEYSNYQLTELIPNWRESQDKGLLILSSPGTFFKETFYDPDIKEVCSELLLADEVIFDHKYKSFEQAPDKFVECEYTKNEVISFIRGEQQWDMDEDDLDEDENKFKFIKAYTWIDMDEDGLKEPYIAVIYKDEEKIVALYPYYDEDTITEVDGQIIKIECLERFTQYRFLPDPEGGPMGLGWGILLGPMFDSINTNVRQLIDSGTLHNASANSGLITQQLASGRGNATQSGPVEVVLGQLTPISVSGTGRLQDNIAQLPFSGPSATLFQLMEFLVNNTRQMTNASINVQAQAGEAASLYLARLQQGLKVPNSIIMRVYECAREEFKKIAALNYKHYDDEKYQRVIDEQASMKQDFNPKDCDVRMAADPTQGSDIERVQRADTIYQMALGDQANWLNKRETGIQLLEAIGAPDIEKIAPEPDPNARDPMQDLLLAQQAAEMELRKEGQNLRAAEIQIKKMRQALDAAKEMSSLGLKADKQEAEITNLYSQALERLVKAGITSGQNSLNTIDQIEERFINTEGGENAGQIPEINSGPSGNMAGQPSNTGLPPVS